MKKCKGINKAKGYGCGDMVKERTYGLCSDCRTIWILETPEGDEYLNKMLLRNKRKFEKKLKKEKNDNKIKATKWRPKLQSKIQEIARLIDVGLPCLARGYHANQIHGGHIFAKGGNSTMALNLHNIHRQSAQSNYNGNDDGLLREGLVNEYGIGYFEFIKSLRVCPALTWSNLDYHKFYKTACEIANDLKKRGLRFEKEDRIEMRNQINNALGIYGQKYCEYHG